MAYGTSHTAARQEETIRVSSCDGKTKIATTTRQQHNDNETTTKQHLKRVMNDFDIVNSKENSNENDTLNKYINKEYFK